MNPGEVASRVQVQYREMADVVLLCECARMAKVFYRPEPILEYRRHSQQVSDRMDHAMEDKLQDYLLKVTRGRRRNSRSKKIWNNEGPRGFFSGHGTLAPFKAIPTVSSSAGAGCSAAYETVK